METDILTVFRAKIAQTDTVLRNITSNRRFDLSAPFLGRVAAVLLRCQPPHVTLRPVIDSLQSKATDLLLGKAVEVLADCEPQQGDTVVVVVRVPPPRGMLNNLKAMLARKVHRGRLVCVAVDGAPVPVYPSVPPSDDYSDIWRAMVPTTPMDTPGGRQVCVRDWQHRPYRKTLHLHKRGFPIESIYLPPNKVGVEASAEEKAAVQQLGSLRTEKPLWDGPLRVPCRGEVTTPYGVRRYYDGVFAPRYFHAGVDYGADVGEDVVMPGGGRVALVGREEDGFVVHGNCVGVDHGCGLTSIFMHLTTVCVKEGQVLAAGEKIGCVGSSGRATGPHLHWGLSVHGHSVDPQQWMAA